jgi:glycosyltransferase involved in cell wall biosynthesis
VGADAEAGVSAAVGVDARSGAPPVRVLHLRDSPWLDGPGRTILETAGRIDRARIDYHIGPLIANPSAAHPLVTAARERGVPVHPIDDDGRLGALVERVLALIDRLGTQVLHSSELRTNLVALQCRRRRPALRIVSTAHGWITNDLRGKVKSMLDRTLLRRFDRVITVSRATRRRMPSWWLPDRQAVVLHNAIATERFADDLHPAPPEKFPPASAVRLANIGRLSPEKGQALLLRAVADLKRDFPQLQLTFAGTGPLEAELRTLAAQLGIAESVEFTGYVADIRKVYDATDLVVQSSFTEGLPNVIVEAAYVGLPIVATDVGGTGEIIEHAVSGWLVQPGSLAELTDGIRRFLTEPGRFAMMCKRARQTIEREFTYEARTARQTDLYREVVA